MPQLRDVRRERTGEHARRARTLAPPPRSTPAFGTSAQRTATDARLRRPSSLPQKLWLGRLLRGATLAGIAGLAAVGVVRVASWVEQSDALPVRSVAVHGVEGARVQEVLAYAGVVPGAPLFAVDVDAVAARVLEHPFVAEARVRRVAPDGLEITVATREARAVLAAGDGLYLVDDAGNVMKAARAGDGLDLPLLTGFDAERVAAGEARADLAAAVAVAQAHRKANAPGGVLGEVHHVPGVGFELVLDPADPASPAAGARVRVGAQDIDAKLARLHEVLAKLAASGLRAERIDIDDGRRPERAAVRLRTGAEMQPAGGTNIPRERG